MSMGASEYPFVCPYVYAAETVVSSSVVEKLDICVFIRSFITRLSSELFRFRC